LYALSPWLCFFPSLIRSRPQPETAGLVPHGTLHALHCDGESHATSPAISGRYPWPLGTMYSSLKTCNQGGPSGTLRNPPIAACTRGHPEACLFTMACSEHMWQDDMPINRHRAILQVFNAESPCCSSGCYSQRTAITWLVSNLHGDLHADVADGQQITPGLAMAQGS
jgi:hypothetical protein